MVMSSHCTSGPASSPLVWSRSGIGVAESASPPAVVAAEGANTVADAGVAVVSAAAAIVCVTVTGAVVCAVPCCLCAVPAQAASVRLRQGISRRRFILSPSSISTEPVFPLTDHGEYLYRVGECLTGVSRSSFPHPGFAAAEERIYSPLHRDRRG